MQILRKSLIGNTTLEERESTFLPICTVDDVTVHAPYDTLLDILYKVYNEGKEEGQHEVMQSPGYFGLSDD